MAGYTLFGEQADKEGFIVAYPDGLGSPATWNSSEAINQADDVAFATALLDTLEGELCIDSDAISLVGYSNGGGMAQRLACLMPERIAALGTVAATYVSCREAVPWIAFHGLEDPLVPLHRWREPAGAWRRNVPRHTSNALGLVARTRLRPAWSDLETGRWG